MKSLEGKGSLAVVSNLRIMAPPHTETHGSIAVRSAGSRKGADNACAKVQLRVGCGAPKFLLMKTHMEDVEFSIAGKRRKAEIFRIHFLRDVIC